MRAGRLRHRINLQSKTQAQNSHGEPVETWKTDATVWASIKPLTGREFENARIQAQDVSHEVEIRYRDSITPEMRVSFTDRRAVARVLDIESVIEPMTLGDRLLLMCRENV